MSSFIIEKEEYVKAAGLVAGSFGERYSRKEIASARIGTTELSGSFTTCTC